MDSKPKTVDTVMLVLTWVALLGAVAGAAITKIAELELGVPTAISVILAILTFVGRVALRALKTPTTGEGLASASLLLVSLLTMIGGDQAMQAMVAETTPGEPTPVVDVVEPTDAQPEATIYTDSDEPGDPGDIE